MTCKTCREVFHYCVGCDSEVYLDNGYCSEGCMVSGREYSGAKVNAIILIKQLDKPQRERLVTLMEDVQAYGETFEKLLCEYMEEK